VPHDHAPSSELSRCTDIRGIFLNLGGLLIICGGGMIPISSYDFIRDRCIFVLVRP